MAFYQENAPILVSWSTVEAYFAAEYGYDLHTLLGLKWRRFKVLLKRGWAVRPSDTSRMRVAEPGFDWNKALDKAIGRETPKNVTRMTVDDLMKRMGGT